MHMHMHMPRPEADLLNEMQDPLPLQPSDGALDAQAMSDVAHVASCARSLRRTLEPV